jgi:hypothetical protein
MKASGEGTIIVILKNPFPKEIARNVEVCPIQVG